MCATIIVSHLGGSAVRKGWAKGPSAIAKAIILATSVSGVQEKSRYPHASADGLATVAFIGKG